MQYMKCVICEVKCTISLQENESEVDRLIEKHQNFEKLVYSHEERFKALERLTAVSFLLIFREKLARYSDEILSARQRTHLDN